MAHDVLYLNPKGQFRSQASYSSRKDFHFCRRYFKLTRIDGWSQKIERVSMAFGKVIEASIQYHCEHGYGPEKFLQLWETEQKSPNFGQLQYSATEVSAENLTRVGHEMLRLFEIRHPKLPFFSPRFQVPLRKEIFPGTSYAAITNVAYLDIIVAPPSKHPSLVPVQECKDETRELLIDCKVMGRELNEQLISLDPQLIEYAWMRQAFDVAFLWFTKKTHGLKFGSRVTLLDSCSPFDAGRELFVLDVDKSKQVAWIGVRDVLVAYEKACQTPAGVSLKGKALDSASSTFLNNGLAVCVPFSAFTKQRLQFVTTRLTPEAVHDMGRLVGQSTVEMVLAHETDFYPQEPGIRFPDDHCLTCSMRSICSNDSESRDRNLKKTGEEWLETELED